MIRGNAEMQGEQFEKGASVFKDLVIRSGGVFVPGRGDRLVVAGAGTTPGNLAFLTV